MTDSFSAILTLVLKFFIIWNVIETCACTRIKYSQLKSRKILEIPVFSSEKKENIVVVNATTNSILFKWNMPCNKVSKDHRQLSVEIQYRPNIRLAYPSTIIWNASVSGYEAKTGYGIHDSYSGGTKNYNEDLKEIFVMVDDLPYSGISYEFRFKKYFLRGNEQEGIEMKKVLARTNSVIPTNTLKTGSGCFHIYNVYNDSRRVKIYWQRTFGDYEVSAFEEEQPTPIFTQVGDMDTGFLWCVISLKHHRLIFRTITNAGVSKEYSIVDIPAQSELLPAINVTLHVEEKQNSFVMTWNRPEGDFVIDSYSVFWIDTLDKKACLRIHDVIFLSPDENSFEIKGKEYIGLALSVNSVSSSSGILVAKTVQVVQFS